MDLIPGLHNHAAWQCLMRLPYNEFNNAAIVSKSWKAEIKNPRFHPVRRATGVTQPAIVVVKAMVDQDQEKYHGKEWHPEYIYQLAIFDLKTSRWSNLPPVPDGLLSWCKLVGVGMGLIVIGGVYPDSDILSNSVFILDFVSGEWRHGAPMPGEPRLQFGCASDSDGKVYVAGGYDSLRNPSKGFMAYDVAEDEWTVLPDMKKARATCRILFNEGKVHVMSDEVTGRYDDPVKREVEVFDVRKSMWELFCCEYTMCLGIYANEWDGRAYKCGDRNVLVRKGIEWQVLAQIPEDMDRVYFATIRQRKLILVGAIRQNDLIGAIEYDDSIGDIEYDDSIRDNEYDDSIRDIEYDDSIREHDVSIGAYAMDLDNYSWKMLDALEKATWSLEFACYLEI